MKLTHCATLLTLVVGCGKPAPETDNTATSSVTLQFDWPEAEGTVKRSIVEDQDGQITDQSSVVYTATTKKTNAGVELRFSDPRDFDVLGVPEDAHDALVQMFAAVPVLTLHRGKVTAIGNTDAMRELVDQLAPVPPDASPEIKARMEEARTEKFFLDAARGEWNTVTTIWHGRSLQVGKPVTGETYVQVLMVPEPMKTMVTMELVEELPCPSAGELRCVRLRYTSSPEPEAMAKSLSWVEEDARRKGADFKIEHFERTIVAEVVTNPDTLLPYAFEQTETSALRALDNGQPMQTSNRKVRSEQYTWEIRTTN